MLPNFVSVEFWRTSTKENTPGMDDRTEGILGGSDSNKKLLELYEKEVQREQHDRKIQSAIRLKKIYELNLWRK